MTDGPLISVGITVHRNPGFLLQSAGSVLSQTYGHLELLIAINPQDAEAPSLTACAESLARFDPRVRILPCEGCRNGFEKSVRLLGAFAGEWCAGIDYDDLWAPDRLACQMPYLGQADVISAHAIYIGDRWGQRVNVPVGRLSRDHFRHQNPIVSPTVLCRVADARLIDPDYAEGPYDYKLWGDLLHIGRRFLVLPDVLAMHRLVSDSYYNSHCDPDVVRRIAALV